MAVGDSLGDRTRRNQGAGARPVPHQEGLAQSLLQFLPEHAREDVGAAARGKRNDDVTG